MNSIQEVNQFIARYDDGTHTDKERRAHFREVVYSKANSLELQDLTSWAKINEGSLNSIVHRVKYAVLDLFHGWSEYNHLVAQNAKKTTDIDVKIVDAWKKLLELEKEFYNLNDELEKLKSERPQMLSKELPFHPDDVNSTEKGSNFSDEKLTAVNDAHTNKLEEINLKRSDILALKSAKPKDIPLEETLKWFYLSLIIMAPVVLPLVYFGTNPLLRHSWKIVGGHFAPLTPIATKVSEFCKAHFFKLSFGANLIGSKLSSPILKNIMGLAFFVLCTSQSPLHYPAFFLAQALVDRAWSFIQTHTFEFQADTMIKKRLGGPSKFIETTELLKAEELYLQQFS